MGIINEGFEKSGDWFICTFRWSVNRYWDKHWQVYLRGLRVFTSRHINDKNWHRYFSNVAETFPVQQYIWWIDSKRRDGTVAISSNERWTYWNSLEPWETYRISSAFSIERILNNSFRMFHSIGCHRENMNEITEEYSAAWYSSYSKWNRSPGEATRYAYVWFRLFRWWSTDDDRNGFER